MGAVKHLGLLLLLFGAAFFSGEIKPCKASLVGEVGDSITRLWHYCISPSKAAKTAHSGRVSVPRSFCIPTVSQLFEDHEERSKCAYDSKGGYRAVGVDYNLDDEVEVRKKEMGTVLADYGKVYEGDACLNDLQINALLAYDAKRALDRAATQAMALDDWCCTVQAVFAELAKDLDKEDLKGEDMRTLVEKASAQKWDAAADALEELDWCDEDKKSCKANAATLRQGCDSFWTWLWTSTRRADFQKKAAAVNTPRSLCVPTFSRYLTKQEGSHNCAYDSEHGFRAVGVGYNLDDDVDQRKKELKGVLADYDKVYDGKQCLNTVQITALEALDGKRYLDRAAEATSEDFDNWCCDMQAVFADLSYVGGDKLLASRDMEKVVDKALDDDWEKAADRLLDSRWCEKDEKRCKTLEGIIRIGCPVSAKAAI